MGDKKVKNPIAVSDWPEALRMPKDTTTAIDKNGCLSLLVNIGFECFKK